MSVLHPAGNVSGHETFPTREIDCPCGVGELHKALFTGTEIGEEFYPPIDDRTCHVQQRFAFSCLKTRKMIEKAFRWKQAPPGAMPFFGRWEEIVPSTFTLVGE